MRIAVSADERVGVADAVLTALRESHTRSRVRLAVLYAVDRTHNPTMPPLG